MSGEPKISILGSEVIIAHFAAWVHHHPQNHDFWDEKLSDGSETLRIDSTREFHKWKPYQKISPPGVYKC